MVKPIDPLEAPDHPNGLAAWERRYLEWLTTKNYAPTTIQGKTYNLNAFIRWCGQRSLTKPLDITQSVLEAYQRHLFHALKEDGDNLSVRSQYRQTCDVKGLFRWLAKQHVILFNPAAELEMPILEKKLPQQVLTLEEVETILDGIPLKKKWGLRDRAMIETLYSTGIRRAELIDLRLLDLDLDEHMIWVRLGKGRKDRRIPIGGRAVAWVRKYLRESRPRLLAESDPGNLFLSLSGRPFSSTRVSQVVKDAIDRAGIAKSGACHLLRHTMATFMLENGADIRYIQQMLGHAELSTTQIYTRVSIRKLKEVHQRTHPAK